MKILKEKCKVAAMKMGEKVGRRCFSKIVPFIGVFQ